MGNWHLPVSPCAGSALTASAPDSQAGKNLHFGPLPDFRTAGNERCTAHPMGDTVSVIAEPSEQSDSHWFKHTCQLKDL